MPECDGIVYNPTTKQYVLATGAVAASTTGHITYKKTCTYLNITNPMIRFYKLIRF